MDVFGYDRTLYILAVTVEYKSHDGRFSDNNKEWAKNMSVSQFKDGETNHKMGYLTVDAVNSGLVDIFLKETRKEYETEKNKSVCSEKKPSIRAQLNAPLKKSVPNKGKTPEKSAEFEM